MLKASFLASVVSFLCFCPWNEQWKSTKSSWLTFSVRVSGMYEFVVNDAPEQAEDAGPAEPVSAGKCSTVS